MTKNKTETKYQGITLKTLVLDNVIFEEIVNSDLKEVDYIYLSANNHLTVKQIQYLFKLKIDNVNINLLRNPYCHEKEISRFITLNDKIYNIAIAHNSNLSQKQINELLKFDDPDVNMSLKFNNLL